MVTGTSIRGIAPVGSNLVTVGREQIESTGAVSVQQILKTVPALTGMGGSGQGTAPGVSYYAPTIHSLGSSASNSTLVLIDGHRIPLGATIAHPLPDPGILPNIALERVEVLAEGSSATYGADAVAGVVNFITRKRYDGVMVNAQVGTGADYSTRTFGALWGTTWDTGSVMAAYGYSYASSVPYNYKKNPFLYPDRTELAAKNGMPPGNTNNLRFLCDPATIQPNGSGNIYTSATSGVSVPNNRASGFCDIQSGDFIPSELRNNFLFSVSQEFGERLSARADFVYSDRKTETRSGRGTLNASAFQTGPQANPFFVQPAGYTGGANRQVIQWNADELLGPGGALNTNSAETWYQTINLEYRLTDRIRLTFLSNIGNDTGLNTNEGRLCGSCATLALNGTTSSGGNMTTPSIPGTQEVVTNLPLTTANALDVWNPAATNRTSAAVLAMLTDSYAMTLTKTKSRQFRLGADGDVFDVPAGAVKMAVGVEAQYIDIDTTSVNPANYGPAIRASTSAYYPWERSLRSVYGELVIPLVSPDMELPLINKLDLSLAARHDRYSDFGNTTNPKFSIDWVVFDGFKLRANWSTAFTAPSPRSIGDPNKDGLNSISSASLATDSATVRVADFPNIVGVPGCPPGSVTCNINSTVPGINRYTGNPNVEPATGKTWSVGFDYRSNVIEGLNASVTYFNNEIEGGITSPVLANILTTGSLHDKLTFCPTGCTQEQIAAFIGPARISNVLAPVTYYLYDRRQGNFLNLYLSGLDFSVDYRLRTENSGTFRASVSGTKFLKYDQSFAGGPKFSVLNTTGFNVTYPSIALQARFGLGWEGAGINASLFMNYVNAYRDWSATSLVPLTTDPITQSPTGGGARVKASRTFDANVSYALSGTGIELLQDSQVYLDVRNLFDKDPNFVNGAGYDPYSGNPLGRVISVGVRAKF